MNTKPTLCLLFLLLPILLFAQAHPPYGVVHISADMYKNANDVVREDYGEVVVKSEKEAIATYKKVVTILNEDSDEMDLMFYYDDDNVVSDISIRIYDALGNLVKKVKKKEINDYSTTDYSTIFGDNRVKHYKADYKSYPFTVEYTFKRKYKGMSFAFSEDWSFQGFNSAIEHSKFVMKLPKGYPFEYQLLNIDLETKKESIANLDTYTWEANKLFAIKTEQNMPMYSKVLPLIRTTLGKFQVEKYEGGMSSWEEYSTFIGKLFDGRNKLPEVLKAEIKTLTVDAKTDIEKIEILYKYMQENMRYVSVQLGIGGWQPFDAEYVYRNKYGDCKALTNYMYAMLGEVGVETYPALIQRGDQYYEINEDFVSSNFNHVVLHIPSEDYWLECTSTDYPPNYLGASNANRNALLIKKEGGHLIKTPELGFVQNVQSTNTQITLLVDGGADIESQVNCMGTKHEKFRYIKHNFSEKETRDWFLEDSSIPSLSVNSLTIESPKDEPNSVFRYKVKSKRFGSKAGKRMFVPLNCINVYKKIPKKKETRLYPIVILENFIEIDTINIRIPVGYEVESIPKNNQQIERDYAKYSFQVKVEKETISVIRRFEIQRTELPAEQYTDYRNFFKKIAKTDGMKVVLVKKK